MAPIGSLGTAGWVVAACIGLVLSGAGNGCGRKLPPIQPGALPPPAVVDLAYEVRGVDLLLSWSLPAFQPGKESAAVGFKILRARQTTAEADCQTCPLPFQEIGDVPASGRNPGSRMRFRDALESGFEHRYKLQAYTADGVAGKDSNVVAVTD